jgi:hypothetical protein
MTKIDLANIIDLSVMDLSENSLLVIRVNQITKDNNTHFKSVVEALRSKHGEFSAIIVDENVEIDQYTDTQLKDLGLKRIKRKKPELEMIED